MRRDGSTWIRLVTMLVVCSLLFVGLRAANVNAQPDFNITISSTVPNELNPPFTAGPKPSGGAVSATPEQAAAFAWEEFIALNWPAGPQDGKLSQREAPSSSCRFGDPNCTGPTVWQTFRGKVEIFPGQGKPPGYPGVVQADPSFGYDALPQYNYLIPGNACDSAQSADPTPWVNLDETDQITLDSMYAGTVSTGSSPGNSAPQLIRFLAKGNRKEYVYVAKNSSPTDLASQWWNAIPVPIVQATKAYLAQHQASPASDSSQYVSLPDGTIEIKAAWRPLNPSEVNSGRFHTQRVRFYEQGSGMASTPYCYRDALWGLVALHIIQKTPSAPYFIYATFEQADNILTGDGKTVEDVDGNVLQPAPSAATTPEVCLQDPKPTQGRGDLAKVIVTSDPKTCLPIQKASFCDSPGQKLFYINENESMVNPPPAPTDGKICVNRRDNDIPEYAIEANKDAHAAIKAYLIKNKITTAPWLYYKLVNVQYYPYDKVIVSETPNGSLYTSKAPYTAQNPAASSFYQANIVVETNRALQLFSGGLTLGGNGVSTDWNADGTQHKNTYYEGKFYNAGGCLGCHGSQGQIPQGKAGDFSVILARGAVTRPEYPATMTAEGMTNVPRNRHLLSDTNTQEHK